eukprot:Skav230988  [mRNA]  locus=scaffold629:186196:187353:+ [translate_table: standard]
MVLYKKRLWTFGGLFPDNPEKQTPHEMLGDLNCFDINSKTWTKVATDGTPEARVANSAVVDFAGTMWLWGGVMEGGKYGNDVYSINLNEIDLTAKEGKSSGAWKKVKIKTPLPGRWQHSTVMNGTGMVIYGGMNAGKPLADVHYLDFEKKMWSEIKCQGDVPPARMAHGAAMTSLGQMWVYGGRQGYTDTSEDLYYLKLDTKTWVKVAAKGVSPGPLQDHVQVMDAAGRMWLAGGRKYDGKVVGGVDHFDKVFYIDTTMETAEWKEVEELRGAALRVSATAAIETNGRMYCYGGAVQHKKGSLPDVLATIAWLDTNQPTPSTATTSAHPLDPASEGGIGAGTILVILLVVAAIGCGGLFLLSRRREMRLLQEVQEPRQVELGPRA